MSLDIPDSLSGNPQSRQLRAEIVVSLFSGSLAAGITRINGPLYSVYSVQEAQVCGLLLNLGRIMSIFYIYEDIERCHGLMAERNLTENEAVIQALGVSFDDIGAAIARHWGLPDVLLNSLTLGNAKAPSQSAYNAMVWYQLCSLFCRRIVEILFRLPENSEKAEIKNCTNHFHKVLQLNEKDVIAVIEKCLLETDASLAGTTFNCNVEEARNILRKASERAWDILPSKDSLVKDRSGGTGQAPIDLIKHILCLIHMHCNFDCTLVCMTIGSSGLVVIAGIGKNAGQLASRFRSSEFRHDIFREITVHNNDIFVADVSSSAYAEKISDWYHKFASARSFAILPLVSDGRLLGMVYGDYSKPHSHAPSRMAEEDILEWRDKLTNTLKSGADNFMPNLPDPFMVLVHRGNKFIMDSKRSSIRIGRAERADIVINDHKASRKHAKIVRRGDKFVFVDLSSNGSYIFIKDEDGIHLRHEEFVLHGSGSICIGRSYDKDSTGIIEFFFQH